MEYILGVDVGTTNLKAIIFSVDGHIISSHIVPSPITILPKGGAIYDTGLLWNTLCLVIKKVVGKLSSIKSSSAVRSIKGVAVASMAEAGVPLDKKGKELYPVIAWYDPRTEEEGRWWKETFGEERILSITGQRIQHIFSANKILWLRNNEPGIYKKLAKWACISDYITFKLTNELAMEYSIASRTMLLDINKKKWSSEILQHAGIDPDILPPLA